MKILHFCILYHQHPTLCPKNHDYQPSHSSLLLLALTHPLFPDNHRAPRSVQMTLKHIKQVSTSGSSRRGGEPFGRARRSACCHGRQPYMPAMVPSRFHYLDTKENKAGSPRVLHQHSSCARQLNDAQLITFLRGADFVEGINA